MKSFQDWKLRTKLLSGFSLVALVALAIGLVGITQIHDIAASDMLMYEDMTVPLAQLGDIQSDVQATAAQAYTMLLSSDPQEDRKSEEKINAFQARIDKTLPEFEQTIIAGNIKEAFGEFVSTRGEYTPKLRQIISMALAGKKKEAYSYARTDVAPIRVKMAAALQKLVELTKGRAGETATANSALADRASFITFGVMGVGILLAVTLGIILASLIGRPVRELAENASTIASGDLTVGVTNAAQDEIGQLARAFAQMVTSLRDTITQVEEASAAVAGATSEISSSTEEMAAGAQEQNTQAGEVASAVEEMTKTIVENSRNASDTAEVAMQAKRAAEQGGAVVGETVEGMRRIADVVNRSAETVKALGKSSDQIGEIIGVIDDIADQTNLLALNAAIEAARAGDQGRGFAVVADEVRNLAMRAAEAAKNTSQLIEGTIKKVKEGSELVHRTDESYRQVARSLKQAVDLVGEITAASQEQALGIEQINKAVAEMDKVVQQNAASAEESASAAAEMNALAEQMKEFVSQLVELVGGNGNGAGSVRQGFAEEHEATLLAMSHQPNGDRKTFGVPAKRTKGTGFQASTHRKQKGPRPEQVIPLEEGDFKEF